MAPREGTSPDSIDPDLETIIIGVDVGLTFTGVSYCLVRTSKTDVIKEWPGTGKGDRHDKVPTAIRYCGGDSRVKSWGFECSSSGMEDLNHGTALRDRFKLYLNEEFLEATFGAQPQLSPGTHEDVRKWFKDFLQQVYLHIITTVSREFGLTCWNSTTVNFLFSVPTLWVGGLVAKNFQKIARDAGFGSGGQEHSVEFDLNEAEAAAIYTVRSSKHQFLKIRHNEFDQDENVDPAVKALTEGPSLKEGDIILVVDSGGGTTDIATLLIESIRKLVDEGNEEEIMKLKTLDFIGDTQYKAIGSVRIDEDFQDLVESRLKMIPHHISQRALKSVADEIVRKRFPNVKHDFGTINTRSLPKFFFLVPGLPEDFNMPEAGIENARLVFTQNEVKSLFDKQIKAIFKLIDAQLERPERVTHIVLSGGLGSSHYVQSCILDRYGLGRTDMQVLVSDKPQLAVCKGLVIDKLHQLKYNHMTLTGRTCRASYGILCYESYNRLRHGKTHAPGQICKNPVDGKRYATKRICWLIKRGRCIPRDQPICRRFSRTITRAEIDGLGTSAATIDFDGTIAVSKTRPDRLPKWYHDGDVEKVCNITYRLPLDQFHSSTPSTSANITEDIKYRKRKRMWPRFPEHWEVELELRMSPGSAGLRFEIFFGDSRIGETDQVPVHWVYPPARHKVDTFETEGGRVLIPDAEGTEDQSVETAWAGGLIRRIEGSGDEDSPISGVRA